jgi:CTP:molybdopterin cytidylyltransferase MocA
MAACLVVMGDQPALDGRVVGRVLTAYAEGQVRLSSRPIAASADTLS